MIEEEANERRAKRLEDDLMTVESIMVAVRIQVEHLQNPTASVPLNSEPIMRVPRPSTQQLVNLNHMCVPAPNTEPSDPGSQQLVEGSLQSSAYIL